MKALQLAVVLLVVCIGCAEALRCNHCVPARVGGTCHNTVKECDFGQDVCISVTVSWPTFSYFRRCSRRIDAEIMSSIRNFNVRICETDRCN